MITINAIGDTCPIPVVKTKKAIGALSAPERIETLVDNEIAVQNLKKMAAQMGFSASAEKVSEREFRVYIDANAADLPKEEPCRTDVRNGTVVAIGSATMGDGNEELGRVLIKGFIYAISQQEQLPKTMLFYNGGAALTCEGSDSIEDLKTLEALGVEILTCGTCLNYYGIADKLKVGDVTNMYAIVEKLTGADKVVRP